MKRNKEAQANWEKLHSRRLQIGFGLLSCVFLFSSAAFLPSFHGSSLASWLLQFFAERLGSEQLHGVCLGGTFVVWLDATPKCPCDRSVIAKLIAQPVRIPRGQLKIFEFLTKCERSVPFLERSLCHKHVTCALTWFISHLAVRVEIQCFRHWIFVWCTMKHSCLADLAVASFQDNTFDLTSTVYATQDSNTYETSAGLPGR